MQAIPTFNEPVYIQVSTEGRPVRHHLGKWHRQHHFGGGNGCDGGLILQDSQGWQRAHFTPDLENLYLRREDGMYRVP